MWTLKVIPTHKFDFELSHQNQSLIELVQLDQFWQKNQALLFVMAYGNLNGYYLLERIKGNLVLDGDKTIIIIFYYYYYI